MEALMSIANQPDITVDTAKQAVLATAVVDEMHLSLVRVNHQGDGAEYMVRLEYVMDEQHQEHEIAMRLFTKTSETMVNVTDELRVKGYLSSRGEPTLSTDIEKHMLEKKVALSGKTEEELIAGFNEVMQIPARELTSKQELANAKFDQRLSGILRKVMEGQSIDREAIDGTISAAGLQIRALAQQAYTSQLATVQSFPAR